MNSLATCCLGTMRTALGKLRTGDEYVSLQEAWTKSGKISDAKEIRTEVCYFAISYQQFSSDRRDRVSLTTNIFDSRIVHRMMCESMLSRNAEIPPMHCCLGEPDCLVGIMLLFQTNWHITCRHGCGLLFQFLLFSMHVSACITSWLCLFLISTSSHDESLAATIIWSRPL